jgi:23S rRNA pseudouridine1911/1915/1917 synthase
MEDLELEILHEDGPILVVLKPPGVLTQAPPGIDSMEVRVRAYLSRRDGRDAKDIYLGVPHRLDRPASGAMVFCTKYRAARKLAEQFEGRLVKKVYWALVAGRVMPESGTWEDYLRKIPGEARVEVVDVRHPEGRLAVLHYRTLAVAEWGTKLEIHLETGRTHQVRVQAASRGLPLLGDFQYGSAAPFGPQHDDPRLRAIALHARTLEFRHPATKEMVTVTAPTSDAWHEFCRLRVGDKLR